MKTRATLPKNKIEHRGFDVTATKNFDLEMKIVKAFNSPSNEGPKKIVKNKSAK